MNEVFVLGGVRTPLGSFRGKLAAVPAPRLGAVAIRATLKKAGIAPEEVSDVFFGNVLQAGVGQAPARQAALYAGLHQSTRCTTVNKVCGSGMEAVILGSQTLALGEGTIVVAGGMENMSGAPYLLPKAREGYRHGHQQVLDTLIHDGLWDPYNNLHMGSCAEKCAEQLGLTREEQDSYAMESFRRANSAQGKRFFTREIVPVDLPDGREGGNRVADDEGPAKVKYDKVPMLPPVFSLTGTITAANASTMNDGAAALVLANSRLVQRRNLKPLARIVSYAGHAHDPLWFTSAPIEASRSALSKAQWTVDEVDLWEVNEAFALVPLVFMRELSVPAEKMNVWGGAISLGHPIGASGARIIVTLLNALQETNKKRGVAAICLGGGEGLAICVELCD